LAYRSVSRVGNVAVSGLWESGMRRFAAGSLLAVAFLLTSALPSDAGTGRGHGGGHHGGRQHHHFGGRPVFIFLPSYSYWLDYPSYYYYAQPIVVQEPPVYIQQQPAPPAASRQDVPWYYCLSAKAYYPWVRTCPEAWVEVPPRPP